MNATARMLAVAAAPVVAAGAATAAVVLTGTHRRLGAGREEAALHLPGDDLLDADVQNDRAVTIAALPERVWPWIAQLGQDKAGFYSFELLENLAGCDIHNAVRIVDEWQTPGVSDPFPLAPGVELRVAVVDPDRALVVTSEGGVAPQDMGMDFTWAFVLTPAGDGTRLHVRERYRTRGARVRVVTELTSVVGALMSWKMLRTIRLLSEGVEVPPPGAAPPAAAAAT